MNGKTIQAKAETVASRSNNARRPRPRNTRPIKKRNGRPMDARGASSPRVLLVGPFRRPDTRPMVFLISNACAIIGAVVGSGIACVLFWA